MGPKAMLFEKASLLKQSFLKKLHFSKGKLFEKASLLKWSHFKSDSFLNSQVTLKIYTKNS